VGQIASYKAAMQTYNAAQTPANLAAVATALAAVANKDITAKTVTDLNAVLGVPAKDPLSAAQIAEQAQTLQASKTQTETSPAAP
jgi:hypothetical protein